MEQTETFLAWRRRLRLTQALAARVLGRTSRQIRNYDRGDRIPRSITLAMRCIQEHQELIGEVSLPTCEAEFERSLALQDAQDAVAEEPIDA
jgi:hypothetical protein